MWNFRLELSQWPYEIICYSIAEFIRLSNTQSMREKEKMAIL